MQAVVSTEYRAESAISTRCDPMHGWCFRKLLMIQSDSTGNEYLGCHACLLSLKPSSHICACIQALVPPQHVLTCRLNRFPETMGRRMTGRCSSMQGYSLASQLPTPR